MTGRLAGKITLVTGAAQGLGAAQARAMAAEGATVIATDLALERAEAVAAEIRQAGGQAGALKLDVTVEADWVAVMARIKADHGVLNVLVNNAGMNPSLALPHERTEDEWDLVMRVNAKSVFLGTKHAVPLMREAGGGSIVNIASLAALGGFRTLESAYVASKAAATAFTKIAAAQYGPDKIRSNSVHPGPIETDMLRSAYATEEKRRARLSRVPLDRFGQPEEIAQAVFYLASDESAYVTGAQLVVDGGSLVH